MAQERMSAWHHIDPLHVAIATRVVVWPYDRLCLDIIGTAIVIDRIEVYRMEMVRDSDASESHERAPKVLMIAGGEHAAASATERFDACAFSRIEAVTCVDGEQPQFIESRLREPREGLVDAIEIAIEIARGHCNSGQRPEVLSQSRKSSYVPVVKSERNRGLDEDSGRNSH